MAQHDYNIANGSGAAVRADVNSALSAIATWNAGSTAPSPTFPNMRWFDTSTGRVWIRDNANTVWLPWFLLDSNGTWELDLDSNDTDLLRMINASGNVVAAWRVDSGGNGKLQIEDSASATMITMVGSGNGRIFFGGDESTGRRVVAPELIDETTITSSTADYTAPWSNGLGYKKIEILGSRFRPDSTDDMLHFRTSTNGGASYDNGASNYAWNLHRVGDGTGNSHGSNSAAQIELTGNVNVSTTNGESCDFRIIINDPANSNCNTGIYWQNFWRASSNYNSGIGAAQRLSEADVDAFRLFFSTQNIAEGQVRVLGHR